MLQHTSYQAPRPVQTRPGSAQKSPPHQPNIVFGSQPAAKPAAQTAESGSKNNGVSASKALKWMALLAAGAVGAGGYIDATGKIHTLDKQNQALQAQLNTQKTQMDDQMKLVNEKVGSGVSLTDLAKIVADVAPGNVMVKGKYGLGSGTWLQDKAGNLYILTNHHVVEDNSIRGSDSPPTFEIRLHNGSDVNKPTVVEGQLIKMANGQYADSAEHDLALIGISTPNFKLPGHIKPMKLRDMKQNPLKAGEFVVIVGTPYGLADNVTHGIISHVERKMEGFEEANVFIGVDAPINPGNSGGSCYDLQGRYIGPPTAGFRGSDGLGFVIRTDMVQDVLSSWGIQTN